MAKKKLAFVLGIRPDIIRAALIMGYLKDAPDVDVQFIWSGQHYSDNLKGIFFREFQMPDPDVDLGCSGTTDAEIASQLIGKLYPALQEMQPDAVVFLGDTNTTMGSIAAAQLNIPIVHIEGCMRSYDWRMPEEKARTLIDHLSDVIYAYEDEYKAAGVAEGLNPRNIVVVRNPIVDILDEFYFPHRQRFEAMATPEFFASRGVKDGSYYLMTCHRRENVHIEQSFRAIMRLVEASEIPVYFPASYRTQRVMKEMKLENVKNLIVVDPIGYEEMLVLMTHAKAVITDSGTVPEECSVLNIPCVQMRKATERPQVYDAGGCVKLDPAEPEKYPPELIYRKLETLYGKKWRHTLGDGLSSKRIAEDLLQRLRTGALRGHLYEHQHLPTDRPLREDGLDV